jgi:anti-sigma B factor antagonist
MSHSGSIPDEGESMARLNVQFDEGPVDVVCLIVEGSLDAHSFEELEGIFERLFEREKSQILVNISGLEYISSAGAAVFIQAASRAQGAGGNMILVDPTPEVMEIFELLGVPKILPIVRGRDEALAAFSTT